MTLLRDDLTRWLSAAHRRLENLEWTPSLDHVGTVEQIGDGVATVHGLPWTRLDELMRFDDGTFGLALNVDEESAGCVLLGSGENIRAGTRI
ncbi:MAG: hypothetical protein O3C34_12475 [Proteobacteria bacterium]|nr:hypothetical protein [Pseudomonadota bacterium]